MTAQASAGRSGLVGRFQAFRERYHLAIEVGFFFAGFLFDVVLLHRIDSTPLLIHQGTYLVLSALLIFWDHRIHVAGHEPGGLLGKLAAVRLWAMHFFLGTLLNAFMVFYFRASSGLLAFCFLVVLAVVIVLNELPQFRSRGPIVRVMLLSFATTSFLAYLVPVLWGELRAWQYLLSVLLGSVTTYVLWRLFRRFTHDPAWTARRAVLPGLAIQGTLLGLYLLNVIPPVPLSLTSIDVFYGVEARRDEKGAIRYALRYAPPPVWSPWKRHDDTLVLRQADTDAEREKVFAFVRIFAPTKFRDQVAFQWAFKDPKEGWKELGSPFHTALAGGSEKGYRTYGSMTGRKAGFYRVHVLTADGREIGRKTFEIKLVPDVGAREVAEEEDS